MSVSTISVIITIAGIIFFGISLAIIILGKKVGAGNTPQHIKLGKLEVNTNSVVTLLIITAVFALAPLGLSYWKPDLSNYVHQEKVDSIYIHREKIESEYIRKDVLESNYLPLNGLNMNIRGDVIDEKGWANGVKIRITRSIGEDKTTTEAKTDQMGSFNIDLQNIRPRERYELNLKKEGYENVLFKFGFLEINARYKLSKLN